MTNFDNIFKHLQYLDENHTNQDRIKELARTLSHSFKFCPAYHLNCGEYGGCENCWKQYLEREMDE